MAKLMLLINKQGAAMSLDSYIKNNDAMITQMLESSFAAIEAGLTAHPTTYKPNSLTSTLYPVHDSRNTHRFVAGFNI